MDYQKLSEYVEKYIVDIFEDNTHPLLTFHNFNHSRNVVSRVQEIGAHYRLNQADLFKTVSAAWFHDIGYLFGPPDGHEARGAEMARIFLNDIGAVDEDVTNIIGCILATKLPQSPVTLLEQIVCDADLYHLGTYELFFMDELMKRETELRSGRIYEVTQWVNGTIKLLELHHFHTSYCQVLLNEQKADNLNTLKRLLDEG